jgi:CubicO group peptidase (beta-lactamase class C family)
VTKHEGGLGRTSDSPFQQRPACLCDQPFDFQPGERWQYSWSNDVLGSVIEEASGMTFEDFVQERIFGPLGMDSTTFFPARNPEIMDRVATLYNATQGGTFVRDARDTLHVDGDGLISAA